jgi:hypothetical protein
MTHGQLLSWFISSYCSYHTRNQSQWQEYIILSDTIPISMSRLLACHVSRGVQCDMLTTIRECPGLCHEGHLCMGGLLAYTILPFYSSPVTQIMECLIQLTESVFHLVASWHPSSIIAWPWSPWASCWETQWRSLPMSSDEHWIDAESWRRKLLLRMLP